MWEFICLLLEISVQLFFFPFLFLSYCCSVDHCAVSGCCHYKYLAFFMYPRVIVSIHPLWRVLFLLRFITHISCLCHLWDVMPYELLIVLFVCWLICWSFSLVHFINGPKYLIWLIAVVFIVLMRFLLRRFVSSSFFFLMSLSFLIFSFISTCLMVSASNISKLTPFVTDGFSLEFH